MGVAKKHDGGKLVAHLRARLDDGFSVLGTTWAGNAGSDAPDVRARTRTEGTWGRWSELEVDYDEGPAPDEEVGTRQGSSPAWVGDADAFDLAVYSSTEPPRDLRVEAIDPGTSRYDKTAAFSPGVSGQGGTATTLATRTLTTTTAGLAGTFPSMPDIVTRRQWGADERLGDTCYAPRFGKTFKMVFVHHTVGSNDYSRAESASIVRGIYAYHTQARGWCDIGYNFLVDRYGTVYEGRAGGIRRSVRGAHAGDYNVNTTGISLMGDFQTAAPTAAMKAGLVELVAWRLGTAYHGAYRTAVVQGERFARISGHRDAMSTACPGQRVYDWLPRLRERVAHRLGDYQSGIERLWRSKGGTQSFFSHVRRGERVVHGGHQTVFQQGRMFSSVAGVFGMRPTPLLNRYVRMGSTGSDMGYPASGVRSPRNGYAADFQGGAIFWSPATGSHVLPRSAVLKIYRAQHGAFGPLGFPATGLKEATDSATARFEHGRITFDRDAHRVTVTYE